MGAATQSSKNLEQQINILQQQKDFLEHGKAQSYSRTFKSKEYETAFVKSSKEHEQLLAKHQNDSAFYHAEQETLKSQTGLFKGTAAAVASSDLEETVGKKVFMQENQLRQLRETIRSYVVQDITAEINGIKSEIRTRQITFERQQRAESGQSSAFKDMGAKVGASVVNTLEKAELHIDGFMSRHSDGVKIAGATAATASILNPLGSAIFLGKHIILSSDSVQGGMRKVFGSAMENIGVDKYSREDLSRYAAKAAALGGAGVSYVQLGKKAVETAKFAGRGVNFVKEVSPITFKFEEGKLYNLIPFDAIKFRNPTNTIKSRLQALRNKYGVVDATVKPNPSWKDSDVLSFKDLSHPVPLTAIEKERVADWMGYRKHLLDMWEKENISEINQEFKRTLTAVKNQLRDHMQPKDLAGILKENRGVKIYDAKGKLLDHINNEWREARTSMENALKSMQNSLHDSKSSPEEITLYKKRISEISKLWDVYEKLLEKIDCQPKPKL